MCHILGDEDDADEASQTVVEAEVHAQWDEPPAPAQPAASSAGAAVAGAPSEFPPSRRGTEQISCAADRHGKDLQIHTDQTMDALFSVVQYRTRPPAPINFGTASPQTRFRE